VNNLAFIQIRILYLPLSTLKVRLLDSFHIHLSGKK